MALKKDLIQKSDELCGTKQRNEPYIDWPNQAGMNDSII